MTPDDDRSLAALARAVLDGEPVDWTAADASGGGTSRLTASLKVIAAIADAHRADASSSHSSADPQAEAPVHWGHLVIVRPLGHGAYGRVYRAWDPRLEREVALKLMPASDGDAASMIHEGRLLARVRHPNVVTIHGADQIGGRVGLWMELVHGRTLHELMQEGGTLTPLAVARIGVELARAASAVHSAGLVHRDIKAQNAMRADDGRVVLMDFGTGRELDEARSDLTGTPLYLAPELFQGQPATPETDVYSLGVLLFYLLTRAFPVHGRTVDDIRRAHEQGTRVTLRTRHPKVPSALARVIDRAIDPRPSVRYRSAEALAAALEKAAASLGSRPWKWSLGAAALAGMLLTLFAWSPAPPVIAIAPFEYQNDGPGGDVMADALSDGFTLELNRRLAQVEGLRVRPAGSSLAIRGTPYDVQEFGRRLGGDHVLAGRVFTQVNEVRRINVSLIRTADGETVWTGSFEPDNRDLFAVQERIALAVADQLGLRYELGPRRYYIDPGLQYLFLRARALRARRDTKSTMLAVSFFEEIVRADPGHVPARAGLAHALLTIAADRAAEPPFDPRAEPLATSAHADDPRWPEASAAMGLLCAHKHDWACARRFFETAMQLAPSETTIHSDFVLTTLLPLGEVAEALDLLERAQAEDPASLDVRRVLAHLQVENGLYDQAIATSRGVLAEDAGLPYAELWLGRALYLSGRPEEALAAMRPSLWNYRAYAYALLGRVDEAEELVAERAKPDARHALVYAGLGDHDRAFDALERGVVLDPWRTVTWMQRPEMQVLRSDPRFGRLRQRLLAPRALTTSEAGATTGPPDAPAPPSAPGGR